MSTSSHAIIHGTGYVVRPLRLDDATALSEFSEDERYWRFLAEGPRTPDQVAYFVARAVALHADPENGEVWWAVEDPDTHGVIGTANLKRIGDAADRNGSVGCTLAPQAQGQGLGTTLGWALIALAFETFHLHRVECTCAVENEVSVHIMRDTYGLTYEGLRKDHHLTPRGWWSSHVFSILEDEYAAKKD